MTDTSVTRDQEAKRYPLSFTQEWFLSMDKGDYNGPFGNRYLIVVVLRITGPVDLAVLQGALDDVVARHELLRTLVVRDADPPYQMVLPPCQVPLEVRNLPPDTGKSRDKVIQEVFVEAETGTISTREVPLLRALLVQFDDRDSALFLTVHHSVSDGWSIGIILRDLGAFYAARVSGTEPVLPQMRQYREYVDWQRASAANTDDDGALSYWAAKLDGAREFVMPTDHGHPKRYSSPYSMHFFSIDADIMAAAAKLANATRGSLFMVVFSAIYILANQITGATDLTLDAITSGRNELAFHNTMGLFLNVLPFRTDIASCTSFRDVVRKTRETFIDAMANELPACSSRHSLTTSGRARTRGWHSSSSPTRRLRTAGRRSSPSPRGPGGSTQTSCRMPRPMTSPAAARCGTCPCSRTAPCTAACSSTATNSRQARCRAGPPG